ncbi:MAG TPA: superoxide dismutase family protein, partial [Thermomicrobiales bacterium]|nr:superoxide dismutase family protein [Thermomicrobiales bacterium]
MRNQIVRPFTFITVSIIALLSLAGVTGTFAQHGTPIADLEGTPEDIIQVSIFNTAGQEVGIAQLSESGDTVTVTVEVTNLPPGEHGIHIHETGLCEPLGEEQFGTAGGHFNPTGARHGGPPDMTTAALAGTPEGTPEPLTGHAGDLGNITAGPNGAGSVVVTTDRFTLSPGDATLFDQDGSAIVIHANADDLTTDPSGESGVRIACGVIAPAMEGGTPAAAS